MIEIKGLTKEYMVGKQVIKAADSVSLTIEQGAFVSIVGHSGSGKTTLLSLIGGLTRPDSGTVVIDGTDLWQVDDDNLSELRSSKMNFIYQFASLIPTLTAVDNVLLPSMFSKIKKKKADAEHLLDLVGLSDKTGAYPAELSGGQQRRVAIARSFLNDPRIILADEPTGDLDEETEAEILQLFKKMNQEHRVTFVLVTHNLSLAARTNKIYQMNNGKLTPFYHNPALLP